MRLEHSFSLGAVHLLLFAVNNSSAFQSHASALHVQMTTRPGRPISASSVRSTALWEQSKDKEQEIAELEERLAALRDEGSGVGDAAVAEEDDELPPNTLAPDDDSFDMNAYRKRVANIKEPPPGEFLSEAWKESVEEQPGLSDTLKTLGIGLGIVLALVAFSQIPIGDEGLTKYSEKIGL